MSEVRADTITASDGTGPVALTKQEAVKMWVNYDGPSNTTDGSLNLSSLTDNSTGDYTLAFSSSFSSATDRCFNCGVWNTNNSSTEWIGADRLVGTFQGGPSNSTSGARLETRYGSNATDNAANGDFSGSYMMGIGDLA